MTMTIVSMGMSAPFGADAPCVSAASEPTAYPQLARVLCAIVSLGGPRPASPPPSTVGVGDAGELLEEQPTENHESANATVAAALARMNGALGLTIPPRPRKRQVDDEPATPPLLRGEAA